MHISLKSKIVLIATVISMLFIASNTLYSWISFSNEYTEATESRAYAIGQFLKYQLDRLLNLHIPLSNIDGFECQCQDVIGKYKDISYAMVVDSDGKILFHSNTEYQGDSISRSALLEDGSLLQSEKEYVSYRDGEYHNITIPVKDFMNSDVGFVRIGYMSRLIEDKTIAVIKNSIIMSFVLLFFSIVILIVALHVWVTNPLSGLLRFINNIRKNGAENVEVVTVNRNDEIGDLSEAFNLMVTELNEYYRKINNYTLELENEVRIRTSKLDAANKQLQDDLEVLRQAEENEKHLQEELQRAHKMEAIGTLVAGVAHDLNNILLGLVTYPDFMLTKCRQDDPIRKHLEKIKRSGKKAAAIVDDLLTLGRRGVSVNVPIKINRIIREYLYSPEHRNLMLEHKNVHIKTDLQKDLSPILGSSIQLFKAIMNLVLNAVEAMPGGGDISIVTENCRVKEVIDGFDEIACGDYVVLNISDSGVGISEESYALIFEPFYTRKQMGRSGTGLGMTVVWSAVKDMNGYIDVYSREAVGTTFKLYFPVSHETVRDNNTFKSRDIQGNGETILVVDDLEAQREMASDILGELNYKVFSVGSGEAAIDFIKEQPVDLLVLDMIMEPGINGYETYQRILKINPDQKAIVVSGFSETGNIKEALMLGAGSYVKKPYSMEEIGIAIRKVFDKTDMS